MENNCPTSLVPPLIFYTDSEIMVLTSAVSAPSENHVDRLNQTPYMF